MTALKFKEDPEPYGEGNIIPFPQKERAYTLKQSKVKVRKLAAPCKKGKERHDSKLITELYGRYVAPYYPSVIRASRKFFLQHTVPFLCNTMCSHAVLILSGAFYKRHQAVFNDCGKAAHDRQTMIAIAAHTPPDLPAHVEAMMDKLRTERQREALRFIANLTQDRSDFYMSCRELQARLLLPTRITAHRILARLCRVGCIIEVRRGMTRQEASKVGLRAMASTFMLAPKQ